MPTNKTPYWAADFLPEGDFWVKRATVAGRPVDYIQLENGSLEDCNFPDSLTGVYKIEQVATHLIAIHFKTKDDYDKEVHNGQSSLLDFG